MKHKEHSEPDSVREADYIAQNNNIHAHAQADFASTDMRTIVAIVSWQSNYLVFVGLYRGDQRVAVVAFEFSHSGRGILTTLRGANSDSNDLRGAEHQQFFDLALNAVLNDPETRKHSKDQRSGKLRMITRLKGIQNARFIKPSFAFTGSEIPLQSILKPFTDGKHDKRIRLQLELLCPHPDCKTALHVFKAECNYPPGTINSGDHVDLTLKCDRGHIIYVDFFEYNVLGAFLSFSAERAGTTEPWPERRRNACLDAVEIIPTDESNA